MSVPGRYAGVMTDQEWDGLRLEELDPDGRQDVMNVVDEFAKAGRQPEAERKRAVAFVAKYADAHRSLIPIGEMSKGETLAAIETAKQVVNDLLGRDDEDEPETGADGDEGDEEDERELDE